MFCGYPGSHPGVKRPGSDADHSPPFSAKIKNEWICTSFPPICVRGVERNYFSFERDRSESFAPLLDFVHASFLAVLLTFYSLLVT